MGKRNNYEVVVGNVGTVHRGHSGMQASEHCHHYVTGLREGGREIGRAEWPVTVFKNGEIIFHDNGIPYQAHVHHDRALGARPLPTTRDVQDELDEVRLRLRRLGAAAEKCPGWHDDKERSLALSAAFEEATDEVGDEDRTPVITLDPDGDENNDLLLPDGESGPWI
jgi:hypothetical protein